MDGKYYVYILTNKRKTTLYTGVTNHIAKRLIDHLRDQNGEQKSFAGKYFCTNLVYYETFNSPREAISREKEIKLLLRSKKEELINEFNPEWKFLNEDFS
jgi:putative endonuclease